MDKILLHGFWGQSSDWQELMESLKAATSNSFDVWAPELFLRGTSWGPCGSLQQWVDLIGSEIQKRTGDNKWELWGYSLGGRLALHVAQRFPHLFERVMVLSSFVGHMTEEEKQKREQWDRDWADQFLEQDWKKLAQLWQQQSVFESDDLVYRANPEMFSRKNLALSFIEWSPAHHFFSFEWITKSKNKIYYFVGERDEKYLNLYQNMKTDQVIENLFVVPSAGHRIIKGHSHTLTHFYLQECRT